MIQGHSLQTRLANGECFLTEAAVVERLRREFLIPPDDHLVYGGAIYDAHSREVLTGVYRTYMDTACRNGLPILLTSSTRRSNRERIAASNHAQRNINQDWMTFLKEIRGGQEEVFLGCLLGTRGDAFRAEEALSETDSYAFHRTQCQACLEGAPDFLMAGVLPALTEAKGMARAMEETRLPFILSFIVRRDGRLLDGTPMAIAMAAIEDASPPLCYMVNCVHPENVRAALLADVNRGHASLPRLLGIQANASTLSPEELNDSSELQCDGSDTLADSMLALRRHHGFQIFGGCCGTTPAHLEAIAARLSSTEWTDRSTNPKRSSG